MTPLRLVRHSLKTRITLSALTVFVISIWMLSLYTSRMLREDMERLLGEQQFSTASFIASQVDDEMRDRLAALEQYATRRVDPSMLGDPAALQIRLETSPTIQIMFNAGLFVTGLDGTAIASVPISYGRVGINYSDRDYIITPTKEGKSAIGKPRVGVAVKAPIIAMSAPIRDAKGKVIGVLVGVTDLTKPNFLDKVTQGGYGKTGGYMLIAPQHRLIVTASLKSRVMETLPSPGIIPTMDRFIQGYESSAVFVNRFGIESLTSTKRVPVADWFVAVDLPTDEAFAPIRDMQQRMLLATLLLTLLTGGLIWWMLRRQLSPLLVTASAMTTLSDTNQIPPPLAVLTQDEVGQLSIGFNRLIETWTKRESALRESEARFRSLTEMSSDFYWETDAEHRLTTRTESKREAAEGVFRTASPIGLRRWEFSSLSPDEAGWLAHRAILDEHLPFRDFEIARPRANGNVHYVSVNGDPIFNSSGVFKGYRGVGVDITERKQAERALREHEERWKFAIEGSGDGVWDWNLQTGDATFSKRWKEMLGFAENEIENHSEEWVKRVCPEDLPGVMAKIQEHLDGQSTSAIVEFRMLAKDGTWKWLLGRGMVVSRDDEGKPLRLVGTNTDITERKQAEEALRRGEARFRSYFNQPLIGIAVTSPEKGWIEVNPRLCEMLGYPREEIVQLTWAVLTHPDDIAGDVAQFERVLRGEIDGYSLDKRFMRKDGTTIHVAMSVSCVRTDDGRVDYFVALIEDVSKHFQLEAQLRESQKMDALGTLAGGVAHDFNNALAAIIGNVELARQDVGPAHPALESLEEIGKASSRAKALVRQILAFGRRQTTERKVISLAPVVQEAAKFLRSTIPAGISLNVECAPKVPSVLADARQIEQVLINLGGNAWHAIEGQERAGLIEIRLEAELRGGLRFAVLTVRDNGQGMDEATRARRFEPFFTTKAVDKGTGLGLSVVYGIAQAHEAGIEVRSTPGEGTAFVIRFAAAQPPAEPVPAKNEHLGDTDAGGPLAVHSEGKRVLYVDDEESIVSLMTRLLGRRGYRVSGFTDPGEALAAVRADPAQFDLAVTDYNMPGISGLDLARTLREIRADLPVMLISGYITEELQREAPAAGVRELIFKADAVEEVCEAVARYANAQRGDKGIS